jgi:hypothetical protein
MKTWIERESFIVIKTRNGQATSVMYLLCLVVSMVIFLVGSQKPLRVLASYIVIESCIYTGETRKMWNVQIRESA